MNLEEGKVGPKLYWIKGPWPGRLAISARPRGGDWLDDEAAGWRNNGIDAVVSFLTPEENADFDLAREATAVASSEMKFFSFPIPDRGVPASLPKFSALVSDLRDLLNKGQNVAIHCRQGIGRSGLVAAALVADNGIDLKTAIETVTASRGLPIPETREQAEWLLRAIWQEHPAASRGR